MEGQNWSSGKIQSAQTTRDEEKLACEQTNYDGIQVSKKCGHARPAWTTP